MPVLPSGRRIEFSLDRFHTLLERIEPVVAETLIAALEQPNDLMPVIDVVYFDDTTKEPFFAGYVLSDWKQHAEEWSIDDRFAMKRHLESEISVGARTIAIAELKNQVVEMAPRLAVAEVKCPTENEMLAA